MIVRVNTETNEIHNFLKDKGPITGDILSPALFLEEWGELD
jgi:hypothetical protein